MTFCDGNTVDGHFLKQDEATGLAVIKISRNDLSKETRDVIAVGELGSASSVNQEIWYWHWEVRPVIRIQ